MLGLWEDSRAKIANEWRTDETTERCMHGWMITRMNVERARARERACCAFGLVFRYLQIRKERNTFLTLALVAYQTTDNPPGFCMLIDWFLSESQCSAGGELIGRRSWGKRVLEHSKQSSERARTWLLVIARARVRVRDCDVQQKVWLLGFTAFGNSATYL